ncbi:MAG: hypothetical protein ACLFTT_00775 [Candidatus Hydrogenedentota bacterium]
MLSYEEQVRYLLLAAEHDRNAGNIDLARYASLRTAYLGHQQRARAELAKLRGRAQRKLARRGRQIQRLLAWRRKGIGTGPIDRLLANCRADAASLNRVASARTAADLGGFEDHAIEHYPVFDKTAPGEFSLTRANLQLLGATALLLVLAVAVTFAMHKPGAGVQFGAYTLPADEAIVLVGCENGTTSPIRLYVPAASKTAMTGSDMPAYGVEVYVRAPGQERFVLVGQTQAAWYHEGRNFERRQYITVQPLMQTELRLDAAALRDMAGEFERLRLVFTDAAGTVLATIVV